MLTCNGQRTSKISRDVSNFIITLVLENSDDLIKNSYRRLTTENVARNEHWSRIAEKVADKFDMPAEMERVKSHFHNRKKVLLSRIKDELRTVPNAATWTTDEKMDELVRRRICIGEYDEQLARVCLDIEEEEKGRTESFGNDQIMQPVMGLFSETSQQSLLSQLLSSSGPSPQESKSMPAVNLSMESLITRGSEPRLVKPTVVSAPLLTKLLTDPSTPIVGNGFFKVDNSISARKQRELHNPFPVNRKRPAESPLERNDRSPMFHNLNDKYISHLIVDIVSPEELKRLLSVLIDNGFTRFQHVRSSDMEAHCSREGIDRAPRPRIIERAQNGVQFDNSFRKGQSPHWLSHASSENERITESPGSNSGNSSIINSTGNRAECVGLDVKLEPFMEEDEELEEELDEQTAELESQLASEAMKNSLALFGKGPSPKKSRSSVYGFHNSSGETVTAICAMCGSEIRLNSGGSKWNFFEHVMMKHSINKPYKCPHCPYQAGRKLRVRQHGQSQHHMATEPIDMTTPEMRTEWLHTMSECFPEHQYGRNVKF